MLPLGNYSLHIAPVAARATAIKMSTLLTMLMVVAVQRYDTMRITRRRRFLAFTKH
jgi:hypothetical protein